MSDQWPLAASLEELIAGASGRVPIEGADGKSGSEVERLTIAGSPYVLKRMRYSQDWLMQVIRDRSCHQLQVWSSGLLAGVPACIDHAVVGAAEMPPDGGALLLRDVSADLVPEGDEVLPLDHHRGFLDAMAQLHAAFWGWDDTVGLTPLADRYSMFAPSRLQEVVAAGIPAVVPAIALEGWERLRERSPETAGRLVTLAEDPAPLVAALSTTPHCFLHGDWKAGNLGMRADGKVILLDWAYPGSGPGVADLAWYLSLNSARLPQSKEDSVETYRSALAECGIDTEPWWDRQLRLGLLGAMVQFGWEKALGSQAELDWWLARTEDAWPLL